MKRRILIVDDEPEFTFALRLNLESAGHYQVGEEHDAAGAVRTARSFDPDLVILDVMMPDLDGGEVAARLRADAMLRDVPVLFLTSLIGSHDAPGGSVSRGGQTYLPKCAPLRELIRCIEQKLAESGRHAAGAAVPPPAAVPCRAASRRVALAG